jgi:methyl-accepting chemotaxis protein
VSVALAARGSNFLHHFAPPLPSDPWEREHHDQATVSDQSSVSRRSVENPASVDIGGVSEAARDTGTAADLVLDSATTLSRQTGMLTAEIDQIVAGVRAA